MAEKTRVRLFSVVTEGSAAGSGSRWNSEREPDDAVRHDTTLLLSDDMAQLNVGSLCGVQVGRYDSDLESMRNFVAHLEAIQAQQRSPQQPHPDLDAELARALAMHPQWRQRMAVTTRSAALRKKILTAPLGSRAVGSSGLGSTHPWRKDNSHAHFTDHNWPKAVLGETGYHLPGMQHSGVEHLNKHPLLSNSASPSFPQTRRFPGTGKHEEDALQFQKGCTPGPGAYFKTVPRGTAFSMDGGETNILGANHVCPWKKCLGRNINPVAVDGTTLVSAPAFSFSKTRRSVSEASLGLCHGDPGPTKTDRGCLSPGPVYEHHGSMQPRVQQNSMKRRAKSSTAAPRVRMVPVAPPREEQDERELPFLDDDNESGYVY